MIDGPNEYAVEKARRAYLAGLISTERFERAIALALRGRDLILEVPLWHEILAAEKRTNG